MPDPHLESFARDIENISKGCQDNVPLLSGALHAIAAGMFAVSRDVKEVVAWSPAELARLDFTNDGYKRRYFRGGKPAPAEYTAEWDRLAAATKAEDSTS